MQLKEIYRSIEREMFGIDRTIKKALGETRIGALAEISGYLLETRGKRLRPALMVLSAKAAGHSAETDTKLLSIAAAVELIHGASLIHDDIVDQAKVRYNKPTVHSRWGSEVSVTAGDYYYSVALNLISLNAENDIMRCINAATKAMCEGELMQINERKNYALSKGRYISIIKRKTASLYEASCHAGSLVAKASEPVRKALKGYGHNLGIAFQIADDCLDVISDEHSLGKSPGIDFKRGELTLPLLNLLWCSKDKKKVLGLIARGDRKDAFNEIRLRFMDSPAYERTMQEAGHYIAKAQRFVSGLKESHYKESLLFAAHAVMERAKKH